MAITPLSPRLHGNAPAVHTRKHRYSLVRALQMAVDGLRLDGIEGEASRELERRTGKRPRGFLLPSATSPS